MKVKTFSIAALLLLASCATHQNLGACKGTTVKNCNPTVYFDSNSTRLDTDSKIGLNWVGKKLSKRTNSKIIVTGYADKIGENGMNMEISKERAETVKQFFVDRHINPARIEVAFKGNQFATAEPEEQYLERKVEITFDKREYAWYDQAYDYLGEKLDIYLNRKEKK